MNVGQARRADWLLCLLLNYLPCLDGAGSLRAGGGRLDRLRWPPLNADPVPRLLHHPVNVALTEITGDGFQRHWAGFAGLADDGAMQERVGHFDGRGMSGY